jgi:GT2 family glycosyltransferase
VLFKGRTDRLNTTGVVLHPDGTADDRDFGRPKEAGRQPAEVFSPCAAAALYRRAMLDEVELSSGILDRNYFMYWEDTDLGWRARLAGWRALYVPQAIVRHSFQSSSRRRAPGFVDAKLTRNRLRTPVKNASWRFLWKTGDRTVADLGRVLRAEGPGALRSTAIALLQSARARAEVAKLVRVPRTLVESEWAGVTDRPLGSS